MPPVRKTSRRELDPLMRARICELHANAKMGYKRIHQVHLKISISTIRDTIKKEQERTNQQSKPRSRPLEKLTTKDKQKLIDLTL